MRTSMVISFIEENWECFERFQTSLFSKSQKWQESWKGLEPDFHLTLFDLFLSQCPSIHPNKSLLPLVWGRQAQVHLSWHTTMSEICCGKNSFMVGKTSVPPWLCCFFPCFTPDLSVHRKKMTLLDKVNLLKIKFPYWNNISKISTINLDCTGIHHAWFIFGRKIFF